MTDIVNDNGVGILDLTNVPRTVQVGELKLNVRPLCLNDLLEVFSNHVVDEKINHSIKMAEKITDTDTRLKFLDHAWDNLPVGSELFELAGEALFTPSGIVEIFSLASGVDKDKISPYITLVNFKDQAHIVNWILGVPANKEVKEDGEKGEGEIKTEAKEEGEKKTEII